MVDKGQRHGPETVIPALKATGLWNYSPRRQCACKEKLLEAKHFRDYYANAWIALGWACKPEGRRFPEVTEEDPGIGMI
jgi:hypothetical protein